jgi:anionic cell wall polymer biosynthesis LytR-Cps2A-Psr (LCP) family protein
MVLAFLTIVLWVLLYVGIAIITLLIAYYVISTAKTLKENSKQQTELLKEIKILLKKFLDEESDDIF